MDISQPGLIAVGGKGGGGGTGPGMPGMDITDSCGNADYAEGGMGGEANQPDGRGGRGGYPPRYAEICRDDGKPLRPYMKRPYWPDEDEVSVGRGGDGPDTAEYKARRLIIETLKADHIGAAAYFTTDVWYNVESAPCEVLNERLAALGHEWRVSMVRGEYTFTDLAEGSGCHSTT